MLYDSFCQMCSSSVSPATSWLGEGNLNTTFKHKNKHHPSLMADESISVSVVFDNGTQQPPVGSWEGNKAKPTTHPIPSPDTWHNPAEKQELWVLEKCCLPTSATHWSWQQPVPTVLTLGFSWLVAALGRSRLKGRLRKQRSARGYY